MAADAVSLEDMLAELDLGQYAAEHSAVPGFAIAKPSQQPDKPRMYAHGVVMIVYESASTAHLNSGPRRRIPKIFHQIFLSGEAFYQQLCANPKAKQAAFTRESCLMFHPTWQHVFW